jgi:hypothetical protein
MKRHTEQLLQGIKEEIISALNSCSIDRSKHACYSDETGKNLDFLLLITLLSQFSIYRSLFLLCYDDRLVMSTIPKRKYKRSDIEANYRNETKTF